MSDFWSEGELGLDIGKIITYLTAVKIELQERRGRSRLREDVEITRETEMLGRLPLSGTICLNRVTDGRPPHFHPKLLAERISAMPKPKLLKLFLIVITATASGWAQPAAVLDIRERLIGTWLQDSVPFTVESENTTVYVRQTVVFDATDETFKVEVFADQALEQPLFTYNSTGPYTLVGPSETVSEAFAINLVNTSSTITAFVDAPALFEATGLDDCGLTVGLAVDVSDGCAAPLFSVADCVDLDLIAVRGDELRFGAEGTDRCVQRPVELADEPYLKR